MFTIFRPHEQQWPIKVWLENEGQIEGECLQQAKNLANLPFIHQWVVLMPDTHPGYGMPIGGVIATENVIIPNAVGVDIGCGMNFVQTDLPVNLLNTVDTPNGKLAQAMVGDILRNIPTGFEHHHTRHECRAVDHFLKNMTVDERLGMPQELIHELEDAYFQVGTLGSGNHFIELQTDDRGLLGIMIHSGSRNIGYKICNYYNDRARMQNQMQHSPVPAEWNLAYLPIESKLGKEYIAWMNLALEFAKENRAQMMEAVVNIVRHLAGKHAGVKAITLEEPVCCHHNYAAYEEHYGKKVWVHRKGAIRAGKGDLGIIPGAMGTYSYLVAGRGNPESFNSCSHGAGRRMSRHEAKSKFSVQDTISDLNSQGIFLGKERRGDVGEESRFAYKEIDFVIANELDLIEPRRRLKTIAVVKG